MEAARHGRDVKTLGQAFREVRHKRSPWIIATAIACALAARIAIGGFSWRDVLAAAAMLVIYPFGEWAIHVYLLHMPPFRIAGRTYYLPTSKAHWEHHKAPTDLGLILLEPREVAALLFAAVPAAVALTGLAVWAIPGAEPWGALTTELLVGYLLVGAYEWTHFLIHTAYRPRSRYYQSVWRTHRLHHFKNEHYWHGITNNVADRALGTFPDQREVPRSNTARTLDISRV